MNLPLDRTILQMIGEPRYLHDVLTRVEEVIQSGNVDGDALRAIAIGDLTWLYANGAHPLLLMKLASALDIDPMDRFQANTRVQPASGKDGRVDN